MVRLTDEEHARLSEAASRQGATLAGYLRTAGHTGVSAPVQPGSGARPHLDSARNRLMLLDAARNAEFEKRGALRAIGKCYDGDLDVLYGDEWREAGVAYRRVLSVSLEPGHPELAAMREEYEKLDARAAAAREIADECTYSAGDAYYRWDTALRDCAGGDYDPASPQREAMYGRLESQADAASSEVVQVKPGGDAPPSQVAGPGSESDEAGGLPLPASGDGGEPSA